MIKFKIFESPDTIRIGNNIIYWREGITFSYCNNKMIISDKPHTIMQIEHKCKNVEYPGRIFIKYKIITFWNYPEPKKLYKIIKDLENILEFDISDYYIEVLLEDGKIVDWVSNLRRYNTKYIKISDYEKYWNGDFDSKYEKYDFSYLKSYYELNEGRKEEILKKFQDRYGHNLGLYLWESDTTKNKAYIEWLLSFVKNNEKKLGIDKLLLYNDDIENSEFIIKCEKLKSLLTSIIKKYDNNKHLLTKKINDIKTIDDLNKIFSEKDGFEEILNIKDESICKVWYNDIEWLVFQPYTFEIAKYANRKERDKNWCTTYGEEHFKNHNGYNGGILYCINKLDPSKDLAFEFLPSEIVIVWDYENEPYKTDIYGMKNFFDKNSNIYNFFDNIIEHEIDISNVSIEKLKEKAHDILKTYDIYELFNTNSYFEYLDKNGYVDEWIKNNVYIFFTELLEKFEITFDDIYEFIIKEYDINKLSIHFNCKKHELKNELKKIGYEGLNEYLSDNEKYKMIKYFMEKYNIELTSEEIYNTSIGDSYTDYIEDIINFGEEYIDDWKEYRIKEIINDMSDEELIEFTYF